MTRGELIELALGKDEARKVDTAIPQTVFDAMTQQAREGIAGWYYAPEAKIFGRLLTQAECWTEIKRKIQTGKLRTKFNAHWARDEHDVLDMTSRVMVNDWPCFQWHAERGEIVIEVVEPYRPQPPASGPGALGISRIDT